MFRLAFLFINLPIVVFSQQKESWMQKPMEQWPQIAMINEVWYKNDERYVHPSFEYVATGFLINTGRDTLAATAKHVLWVAKSKAMKSVYIDNTLENWVMHPKGILSDSVIIDQLINSDSTEVLEGQGSSIQQRDWIVFTTKYVSPNIQPLKPRYTPLEAGESLYFFACPYDEKRCITKEAVVLQSEGPAFLFSIPENNHLGGASGSPIVDKNGYLVGILSGSGTAAKTGAAALLGISTYYLKRILNNEQPLNTPLIPIGDILKPIISKHGYEAALKKFDNMKRDRNNFYIYDFGTTGLNPLAATLLKEGKTDLAIAILKLSIREYQWAALSHANLGKAYLANKEKALAIKSYERAAELWPKNEEIQKALKALKE